MKAKDVIENIRHNELNNANFKYCLVKYINEKKIPFTVEGKWACSNKMEDFVTLDEIEKVENLDQYAGLGTSVQASKVCGVDIDHCVNEPFNKDTINNYARGIIDMFKDFAYIEFSFSGTGIRMFFRDDNVFGHGTIYFIKNESNHTEYYQPGDEQCGVSNRFLTVTGVTLYNNPIDSPVKHTEIIKEFLEKYMKRPVPIFKHDYASEEIVDERSIETLKKNLFNWMIIDSNLAELWFHPAPGSGSDESERDFHLCQTIYNKVTKDKDKIRTLFEMSDFYKSKDFKHLKKWEARDHRYYNLIYDRIRSTN